MLGVRLETEVRSVFARNAKSLICPETNQAKKVIESCICGHAAGRSFPFYLAPVTAPRAIPAVTVNSCFFPAGRAAHGLIRLM